MQDLLLDEALERWRRDQVRVAIARVVDIDGSGLPDTRPALAVNERGEVTGSMPEGCTQSALVAEVLDVLEHGYPKLVSFGRRDDETLCHFFVEPLTW